MSKTQNCINALKNLQLKIADAEAKLNDEINQLECKHAAVFETLFNKRAKIINGEYEPSDEESKWAYENGEQNGGGSTKKLKTDESDAKKSLAGFWPKVLQSANLTRAIIQEHDEPILACLRDIKCKLNNEKPYGFTLEFHFNDNEFFKNQVLTKSYEMAVEKDPENPLLYNNNSLYKALGCKIEWNEDKKPKSKDEEGNSLPTFFEFFTTQTPDGVRPMFRSKNDDVRVLSEKEEEIEQTFEFEYELGQHIKDVLIPKAVLYFTGDIDEDEMDGDFDEDDEDSDDDDDDDNDDDDAESEDDKDSKPNKKVKSK